MKKKKPDKNSQNKKKIPNPVLTKLEMETAFDFKQHTWADVTCIQSSLGRFHDVKFTDIDKYFLTKRNEAVKKRYDTFAKGTVPKQNYILSNMLAPGYGKLDADCYILTAASIFILDCLTEHNADLSDLYSLLPNDEALISNLIRTDVNDVRYDSMLIASVEYVLRYRYKDFSSSYYDELENYRSLVAKLIKPKSETSAYYSNFLKLLNLIPEERKNLAVSHFNSYHDAYLKQALENLQADYKKIENAVKAINRFVDLFNAEYNSLQDKIGNAVLAPGSDDSKKTLIATTEGFSAANNSALYLHKYEEKQLAMNKLAVDLSYKYSIPETLSVAYQNPEYNPYELCFALLLMIEQEKEFIWLYGETVQMMYTVGRTLPWGIKLSGSQPAAKATSDCQQEEENTAPQMPEHEDWYHLAYSTEDDSDNVVNLANLVYSATGFIMPRNTSGFDNMYNSLKNYGIKNNTVCEMLIKCMTLAADSGSRIQAVNLNNTSVEEELSAVKEELTAARKELSEKNAEIAKYQKESDKISKQMKKFLSEIHKNTDYVTKAAENVKIMEERVHERDEIIDMLLNIIQTPDKENTDESNQYPFAADKRIVIFGGYDNFEREMRSFITGNVKFVKRSSTFPSDLVLNADSVWIQINAIDHPMYYRISSLARKHKIPIQYFKQVGAKQCVNQIISYYRCAK